MNLFYVMKGADMQEVFEKIIEKLEEDEKHTFDGCINKRYAIEIVKQEAERCKGGHFGCNTNGEHEKCNGCGLTYCKSRNKIWFGALDDGTDTNVGSNGWILCSGCADCNHKECEHYGKVKDLTGMKFGKLTVLEMYGKDKYNKIFWKCRCDCGNETITYGRDLVNGHCKSCGCLLNANRAEKGKYK